MFNSWMEREREREEKGELSISKLWGMNQRKKKKFHIFLLRLSKIFVGPLGNFVFGERRQ